MAQYQSQVAQRSQGDYQQTDSQPEAIISDSASEKYILWSRVVRVGKLGKMLCILNSSPKKEGHIVVDGDAAAHKDQRSQSDCEGEIRVV
eukprot:3300865-Prymnesium_polylepis.1